MMQGELERAIADFDHAIVKRGDQGAPWVVAFRGECHAAMGKFDSAIADFTTALKRDRNRAKTYQHRAAAYEEKGKLDLALADLDQVVRLRPSAPEGYVDRSILLIEMKRNDRALEDMNRIVELCPEDPMGYFLRALALSVTNQDWKRALADMDRAVKLEPRFFLSYAVRAFLQIKNNKYAPALADLAMCGLTLDQSDFRVSGGVNTYRSQFYFGVGWELKDDPVKSKSGMLTSPIERRAIDQGLARLLAAAFPP